MAAINKAGNGGRFNRSQSRFLEHLSLSTISPMYRDMLEGFKIYLNIFFGYYYPYYKDNLTITYTSDC